MKVFYKEDKEENEKAKGLQKHGRFIVPLISMACFFIGCCLVATIISNGDYSLRVLATQSNSGTKPAGFRSMW